MHLHLPDSRPVVIQAADLREQMRREVAEHEAAHRRSAQLLAEAQVYSIQLYIAPAVYNLYNTPLQARQVALRQCVEQMAEDNASELRGANAEARALRLQLNACEMRGI